MTTSVQNGASQSSALAALTGATNAAAKSGAAESADQFLTLLVTQMKNQDPLNPMNNAEMTSQLAQINTVKGISQLNESMGKLLGAYNDAMSMQSASMIGKNILSAGNELHLGSAGAIGGIELAGKADAVTVVIKDASGKEVARESLGAQPAGIVPFGWDGKGLDDQALTTGKYTFSVEAKLGSQSVKAEPLQAGTVSALVRGQNGFQLEVGNEQIAFDSVKQIF